MPLGEGLERLEGFAFEVRCSAGVKDRARATAELTADACRYLTRRLSGVTPDLALIVVDERDWTSRQPYGLPYFDNAADQIRPGILVMPAGPGPLWEAMVSDLRDASPRAFRRVRETYPDGAGGVDLQPFFDLVTIHELGHAYETFGELRLPTFWLSEIFANLALHAFVASEHPELLDTLEVLSSVGAASRTLAARMRAEGYTLLEDLQTFYTGGDRPMSARNYVWYQYRWQRLVARMVTAEGEQVLTRFWEFFRSPSRPVFDDPSPRAIAPILRAQVSPTLGRAVATWR